MTKSTTTFKAGDSAVYTDSQGNTQSVKIMSVLPRNVLIAWPTGPRTYQSKWLTTDDAKNLTLFPTGVLFMTV